MTQVYGAYTLPCSCIRLGLLNMVLNMVTHVKEIHPSDLKVEPVLTSGIILRLPVIGMRDRLQVSGDRSTGPVNPLLTFTIH